jgi:hypothetical protein
MAAAQDSGDWSTAFGFHQRAAEFLAQDPAGLVALARLFAAQQRFDLAMASVLFLANIAENLDVSTLRAQIRAGQDVQRGGPRRSRTISRDILIVCPIHVGSLDRAREIELWQTAIERFNPGIDWLMLDDGSPRDRLQAVRFAPGTSMVSLIDDTPQEIPLVTARTVAAFPSNVGHYFSGRGNDGPGRSIAAGVKTAIGNGYRHVVVLEADLYTRLDLRVVVGQMRALNARAMTTRVRPWNFIESGFMVFDADHLHAIGYADRYAWDRITYLPQLEWVYEATMGEFAMANWSGGRNDFDQFDANGVSGLDYLTHCQDARLYLRYIDA